MSNIDNIIEIDTQDNVYIIDNIDSISINEYDEIKKVDYLLLKEQYNWLNLTYDIINEYIQSNILDMCNNNFDETLISDVHELLFITFENIFNITRKTYDYLYTPTKLIDKSLKIIYNIEVPRRSYKQTFIRNIKLNIDNMGEKITALQNIKQPDQRTEEWKLFRHQLITASNLWKIFDSDSLRNSLIYEKCMPYCGHYNSSNSFINTNTTLHWGNKYEPVSTMLYEFKYKTVIGEFGCIPHPRYKFIGASPDGINIDQNSPSYGRMLEIKNIVNRDITKIPKKEYWIQMQIQMEVCDLNECDFLETRFKEYNTYEDYLQDGTNDLSQDGKMKGKILMFYDNNIPIYEYYVGEIHGNYELWETIHFEKNKHNMFMRTIYWKLDEFSCILILRNKLWFQNSVEQISNTWETIKRERETGYEHRAPKKRERKNSITSDDDNKCHILLSNKIKTQLL